LKGKSAGRQGIRWQSNEPEAQGKNEQRQDGKQLLHGIFLERAIQDSGSYSMHAKKNI